MPWHREFQGRIHIGAYSFSARRWFDRSCGVSAILTSSKRQQRLPGYLTNSVVTTRLPQYRDSDTISEFRALIVDIIEGFKSELDGRFSSSYVGIWDSFQSLSPQFDKDKFLDQQRLDKLLVNAINVPALKSLSGEGRLRDDVTEARHDLKAECRIHKRSLLSAF